LLRKKENYRIRHFLPGTNTAPGKETIKRRFLVACVFALTIKRATVCSLFHSFILTFSSHTRSVAFGQLFSPLPQAGSQSERSSSALGVEAGTRLHKKKHTLRSFGYFLHSFWTNKHLPHFWIFLYILLDLEMMSFFVHSHLSHAFREMNRRTFHWGP
jgi:hypothetical protein